MGTCCSSRNDKLELKNEFTVKTQLIHKRIMDSNHLLSLTQENQYQTNEFFALHLSKLISSNPQLLIKAIGLDVIWNIVRTYQNDFTSNNYILNDLRDKPKRKENFLKKFKCINYSIKEIDLFTESKMLQLSKYLNNKTIIIISQSEDLLSCEQFIKIILNNEIKVDSILVLNTLLEEEYQDSMSQLYSRMDDRWFIHYPYILLALKSFSYLKSMSYIFIDKNTNGLLSSDSSHIDSKYDQFLHNVNTKVILYLTGEEDQFSISALQSGITIIKINPSINIQKNKGILQSIEIAKSSLLSQGSFIILYEKDADSITDIIIVNWIINILYQLTYYSLNEIKEIMTASCIYLINGIEEHLKTIGNDNLLMVVESGKIKQNDIKDKFDINLLRLKNRINSLIRFQAICSVIEKIILNILTHPEDKVYYNIKCESNTFKVNISANEYARIAFETFGFKLNKGTQGEYYSLGLDTDIECLREIYFCFIHSIKRTIANHSDDNSELSD